MSSDSARTDSLLDLSAEAAPVSDSKRKSVFSSARVHGDRSLWILYFALIATSLLFIFSATSTLAYQGGDLYAPLRSHLAHVLLSVVVTFALSHMGRKSMKGLPILFLISSIAVIATLFFGSTINDAKRSIFGLQPSEFFKLSIIFLAARLLSVKDAALHNKRYTALWLIVLVPLLAVMKESLSMGLIICIFLLLIGFVEMGFKKSLLRMVALFVAGGVFGMALLTLLPEHIVMKNSSTARWRGRIESFFSPPHLAADTPEARDSIRFAINGDNFQEQHAKIAIARSNGWGVFPGNSLERDILPQAYSDFIYAIIIEETGFLGMIWVPLLYILLFFKLSRWARRSQSSYRRLILLGVGLMYTTQAIVNMAVVAGVIPNTGQTLPLISRGGSSLLSTSMAIGICIAITRIIRTDEEREKTQGQNMLPDNSIDEPSPGHSATDDTGALPAPDAGQTASCGEAGDSPLSA